eukprot:Rmarinus@m.29458
MAFDFVADHLRTKDYNSVGSDDEDNINHGQRLESKALGTQNIFICKGKHVQQGPLTVSSVESAIRSGRDADIDYSQAKRSMRRRQGGGGQNVPITRLATDELVYHAESPLTDSNDGPVARSRSDIDSLELGACSLTDDDQTCKIPKPTAPTVKGPQRYRPAGATYHQQYLSKNSTLAHQEGNVERKTSVDSDSTTESDIGSQRSFVLPPNKPPSGPLRRPQQSVNKTEPDLSSPPSWMYRASPQRLRNGKFLNKLQGKDSEKKKQFRQQFFQNSFLKVINSFSNSFSGNTQGHADITEAAEKARHEYKERQAPLTTVGEDGGSGEETENDVAENKGAKQCSRLRTGPKQKDGIDLHHELEMDATGVMRFVGNQIEDMSVPPRCAYCRKLLRLENPNRVRLTHDVVPGRSTVQSVLLCTRHYASFSAWRRRQLAKTGLSQSSRSSTIDGCKCFAFNCRQIRQAKSQGPHLLQSSRRGPLWTALKRSMVLPISRMNHAQTIIRICKEDVPCLNESGSPHSVFFLELV